MSSNAPRRGSRLRQWLLGLFWVPAAACATSPPSDDPTAQARERMVERQIASRGIDDARVLAAMRAVPRHRFVPEAVAASAYLDQPLPIGHDQTISQPYVVALMTSLARPAPGARVLEVGTGSGYQAAVLAEMGAEVYTIEIVEPLAARAAQVLEALGYDRVHVRAGDGYAGWPEHAPYDAIVVTAAPERIPRPLLDQLAPGGRLVIPVGPVHATQELRLVEKDAGGQLRERSVTPVRFVPLTGEAADRDRGGR
ncbi:protein-L-isoaspartate(D-aspartate) O-methyltransferase [Luteimonas sp. J16]|uniref:protein-L-isoaspartate(D-aspartate) O-methyltransferase n=1 Tax=unclassified Luteimonas TaxID=2629088 RepID=UPI0004B63B20|nr:MULTISPECIES: protein-L-isoaspartate(D-aspartate) O-methyltransferase [unclassified Luteimonas]TWG94357.1 protein-L-isoaspartate(D-aspartate) O-methyltransferase [Luteimonas sp. J16]HLT43714.1 protein-L-isoaspartate(D-aspartate) O-methyltransferase [Luteimonas sp.]